MKAIFKTGEGYFKVKNNGKFVTNETIENAQVVTTKVGISVAKEMLDKHNVKYDIEYIEE